MARKNTVALGIYDPRVRKFAREVSRQILDDYSRGYINGPITVASVMTGGTDYALALYSQLLKQRINDRPIDVKYTELKKPDMQGLTRENARGRVIIPVDDAIWTGDAYDTVMRNAKLWKSELGIHGVRYAAAIDTQGRAIYACEPGFDMLNWIMWLPDKATQAYRWGYGWAAQSHRWFKSPAAPRKVVEMPVQKAAASADSSQRDPAEIGYTKGRRIMTRRDGLTSALFGLAALGSEICDKKK
jgi:hypothetical protein